MNRRVVLSILFVLLGCTAVRSQWKNIAPNLVGVPSAPTAWGGCIMHYGNNIWAGYKKLFFSSDFGTSWQDRTPPQSFNLIYDITFYNENIGLVVESNKIFKTLDQGITWQDITPASVTATIISACFGSSTMNIIACCGNGTVVVSTNGGNSWKTISLGTVVLDVSAGSGGTVFAITGNMFQSSDNGATWIATPGTFDFDSYSFKRDLCDTNIFYVSNEEILGPKNNMSELYVSTDAGNTWVSRSAHPDSYYCGSIALASSSVFAQTYTGVERSTDKGLTWKDIHGPPNNRDSRMVTALSDNIVFAIDSFGSVWATFNGGGDSVSLPGPLSVTPASLFSTDTIFLCESPITDTIHVGFTGCSLTIISQTISGPNASDYQLLKKANTTITPSGDFAVVSFIPSDVGLRKATYELVLNNGEKITIPLAAYCAPTKPLAVTTIDLSTDTLGGSIAVPITVAGLDKQQDIELSMHYTQVQGFEYNGSYSVIASPLDIPGMSMPGRSRLSIRGASNNTLLGYANFTVYSPIDTIPKVWFDSLVVVTATVPCEYDFLSPAISVITPPSGCGTRILSTFLHTGNILTFSIYPNPSTGSVTMICSSSISAARIEVFDQLGVCKYTTLQDIKKDQPLPLNFTELVPGMYLLRITSPTVIGAQTVVLQK